MPKRKTPSLKKMGVRKRKAVPAVGDIALTPVGVAAVPVDPDLFKRATDFAGKRGLDIGTLVRVALSSVLRTGRFYAPDTKLTFGKYVGETMETVIRLDPGYVRWALDKIEGLCLSPDAEQLLDVMLKQMEGPAS